MFNQFPASCYSSQAHPQSHYYETYTTTTPEEEEGKDNVDDDDDDDDDCRIVTKNGFGYSNTRPSPLMSSSMGDDENIVVEIDYRHVPWMMHASSSSNKKMPCSITVPRLAQQEEVMRWFMKFYFACRKLRTRRNRTATFARTTTTTTRTTTTNDSSSSSDSDSDSDHNTSTITTIKKKTVAEDRPFQFLRPGAALEIWTDGDIAWASTTNEKEQLLEFTSGERRGPFVLRVVPTDCLCIIVYDHTRNIVHDEPIVLSVRQVDAKCMTPCELQHLICMRLKLEYMRQRALVHVTHPRVESFLVDTHHKRNKFMQWNISDAQFCELESYCASVEFRNLYCMTSAQTDDLLSRYVVHRSVNGRFATAIPVSLLSDHALTSTSSICCVGEEHIDGTTIGVSADGIVSKKKNKTVVATATTATTTTTTPISRKTKTSRNFAVSYQDTVSLSSSSSSALPSFYTSPPYVQPHDPIYFGGSLNQLSLTPYRPLQLIAPSASSLSSSSSCSPSSLSFPSPLLPLPTSHVTSHPLLPPIEIPTIALVEVPSMVITQTAHQQQLQEDDEILKWWWLLFSVFAVVLALSLMFWVNGFGCMRLKSFAQLVSYNLSVAYIYFTS